MTLSFLSQADYFWALLPEIVLCLGGMVVLLVDVFQKGSRSQPSRAIVGWLALASLIAAAAANLWLAGVSGSADGVVALDGFRIFANFVILLAAALCVLLSFGYLDRREINRGEYYALVLFGVVGMMLMAGSRDLILTFIALELMSIAVYVLVGFDRRDPRSGEGALKYFLLGAVSSAFFLYGIALVFGATGTTHLELIAAATAGGARGDLLLLAGMALVLVGFAFKVAAVPFHMWTPDAYDGAPTPITALMATGVKAGAFAAFIRVFAVAFAGAQLEWGAVVWWLAVLTMLGANLVALTQGSVKRMLAYSSIAHAGYLLVALLSGGEAGGASFLFYLLAYTLMTVGSFGIVIANARGDDERIALEDYAGLGWEQPLMGAAFTVFLLSLAGFPLTGGFIGKLYILRAAVGAGQTLLAVVLVIASLISYFYYLRLVVVMYMQPAAEPAASRLPLPLPAQAAIALAGVAVLLLFFWPAPLLDAASDSVASLFPTVPLFGMVP
jgi:NADH-quinone oxidoreductase subunit N